MGVYGPVAIIALYPHLSPSPPRFLPREEREGPTKGSKGEKEWEKEHISVCVCVCVRHRSEDLTVSSLSEGL